MAVKAPELSTPWVIPPGSLRLFNQRQHIGLQSGADAIIEVNCLVGFVGPYDFTEKMHLVAYLGALFRVIRKRMSLCRRRPSSNPSTPS